MFSPGFAQIRRLLDGDTVARKSGVNVGDCIVAVSGQGFRRFAPDYKEEELENLSKDTHMANDNNVMHVGQGEGRFNIDTSTLRVCVCGLLNSHFNFCPQFGYSLPSSFGKNQDHQSCRGSAISFKFGTIRLGCKSELVATLFGGT